MIIAIDFDGTIVENKYPAAGKMRKGAARVINKWYNKGCEIIIWTCRFLDKDLNVCVESLRENGIKYHKINQNSDKVQWKPFPKIYYDVLIDDRQVGGIKDWDGIDLLLEEHYAERYNIMEDDK